MRSAAIPSVGAAVALDPDALAIVTGGNEEGEKKAWWEKAVDDVDLTGLSAGIGLGYMLVEVFDASIGKVIRRRMYLRQLARSGSSPAARK
jgi:hypothetical protein